MREATSQILAERARGDRGLERTLAVSVVVHALVIVVMVFAPEAWISGETGDDDTALDIMTLRLGGPEGPGEGGLTPLGGRAVVGEGVQSKRCLQRWAFRKTKAHRHLRRMPIRVPSDEGCG